VTFLVIEAKSRVVDSIRLFLWLGENLGWRVAGGGWWPYKPVLTVLLQDVTGPEPFSSLAIHFQQQRLQVRRWQPFRQHFDQINGIGFMDNAGQGFVGHEHVLLLRDANHPVILKEP
jgi:hypothetical protein